LATKQAQRRTTDYGTILLHALVVISFGVLVATGLRIATDDPEVLWIGVLDSILPTNNLWLNHLVAGLVLTATMLAYFVYVRRARLGSRVRVDRARLLAVTRLGPNRWSAAGVLVYWVLMAALVTEIVTGLMLFAEAGRQALTLHLYATYVSIIAALAHVAAHAAYGGLSQLLRIVRPAPLYVAEPPLDLAELLAEQLARNAELERIAYAAAAGKQFGSAEPTRPKGINTLNSHPFALAMTVLIACSGLLIAAEQTTRPVLNIPEISATEVPRLDGDLSDPIWARAKVASVLTTQGGDFDSTHQSLVEVRAIHDDRYAYFAFVWTDPTRSLKHHPLMKSGGRWSVVATRDDLKDETVYHEDKFAVLLARPGLPLIGAAIHLARRPLPDQPPSATGRGLHYTDGSVADVWQWRASHGGIAGHIDNAHFGAPASAHERRDPATARYAGGYALDPAPAAYEDNFVVNVDAEGNAIVHPKRVPRDLAAMSRTMGRVSGAANESEAESARWWMTMTESVPRTSEIDAKIPDGTVIPGILMSEEAQATSGGLTGAARWASGRWSLEIARPLYSGSPYDVPIKSGVLMWVAAFDHAEKRHTRHLRPFRLEVD
jgi:cytochrome b subunit of formate dehydrogenase